MLDELSAAGVLVFHKNLLNSQWLLWINHKDLEPYSVLNLVSQSSHSASLHSAVEQSVWQMKCLNLKGMGVGQHKVHHNPWWNMLEHGGTWWNVTLPCEVLKKWLQLT